MNVLHSHRLLAIRDRFPHTTLLNVSAHRFFGCPVLLLPVPTPRVGVACAHLRWSIRTTWPPHFHLRQPMPWCPSCWFSALLRHSSFALHTNFSILRSIFRWQVWTIICSFTWSDRVWAPYNRTGNSPGFHDGFLVSRFWNLSASISYRVLNLFQAIPILLLIYFPEFLRSGISCPTFVCSGTYSRASPFSLILISALFVITLVCFVLILVQHLCLVCNVQNVWLLSNGKNGYAKSAQCYFIAHCLVYW